MRQACGDLAHRCIELESKMSLIRVVKQERGAQDGTGQPAGESDGIQTRRSCEVAHGLNGSVDLRKSSSCRTLDHGESYCDSRGNRGWLEEEAELGSASSERGSRWQHYWQCALAVCRLSQPHEEVEVTGTWRSCSSSSHQILAPGLARCCVACCQVELYEKSLRWLSLRPSSLVRPALLRPHSTRLAR